MDCRENESASLKLKTVIYFWLSLCFSPEDRNFRPDCPRPMQSSQSKTPETLPRATTPFSSIISFLDGGGGCVDGRKKGELMVRFSDWWVAERERERVFVSESKRIVASYALPSLVSRILLQTLASVFNDSQTQKADPPTTTTTTMIATIPGKKKSLLNHFSLLDFQQNESIVG